MIDLNQYESLGAFVLIESNKNNCCSFASTEGI